MLIPGHEKVITNDQRYVHTGKEREKERDDHYSWTNNFSRIAVCVRVCTIVIKMSPNVRYWTTTSWNGDGFCLRLLFYYLVVHTTYILISCRIRWMHFIIFHFISFLSTSFHSISVIRKAILSSVPTHSCVCTMSFHRVECAELLLYLFRQ